VSGQSFLHALILPRPTQTRNSGRVKQCWVWLDATEGGLGVSQWVRRRARSYLALED